MLAGMDEVEVVDTELVDAGLKPVKVDVEAFARANREALGDDPVIQLLAQAS
jgi:hypothetical protein